MSFVPHHSFVAPSSPDARIWRYTDLAKLLSLLDRNALFFPRVDKLEDPFEGFFPRSSAAVSVGKMSPMELKTALKSEDENLISVTRQNGQMLRDFSKLQRELTFVNSWHCQEYESAAMWSQYLRTQEGIAIQSTYQRLCQCVSDYKDFDIFIGLVSYRDYDVDSMPEGNSLVPVMSKRRSFEHERELRALIWTLQYGKNGWGPDNKFKSVSGLYVPISITNLIERIYVAPTAPVWVLELLESLIKRYGLSIPVCQSSLAETPLY